MNRKEQLQEKLEEIRQNIERAKTKAGRDEEVTLLCVTKQSPIEDLQILYDLGVRDFGENRAQTLAQKAEAMPADARFHMIGSMQTNKLKYILPHVHLLQSLDRESLVDAIEKRCDEPLPCLLEVNIAEEEEKQGMDEEEVLPFLSYLENTKNIHLIGLMVMASHTEEEETIRRDFKRAKKLYDQIRERIGEDFSILSMGMSYDYEIAVEEGANMVRIGSALMRKE